MPSSIYSTLKNIYQITTRSTPLISTRVKNQALASQLEKVCDQNQGILTFSQYLVTEQTFANHREFEGTTTIHQKWDKALARFCQENQFNSIIEFGCGSGNLAVAVISEFKKISSKKLLWSGIEINTTLHQIIKDKFAKHGISDYLSGIHTSIDIKNPNKSLVIFPYSFDSIPPEIFTNTGDQKSYPNALIGISVKKGLLKEVIIPPDILAQKNISFKKGFFTSQKHTFDLRTWQIYPTQRAYIQTGAFSTLRDCLQKIPRDSMIIIIDEFRKSPLSLNPNPLGTPKKLKRHSEEIIDPKKIYQNPGQDTFYFPAYLDTFRKYLHSLGLQSIKYGNEQEFISQTTRAKQLTITQYSTYFFLGTNNSPKSFGILPINFYPRKIY